MSETETREVGFFDADEPEQIRYRAVSRLALVALVVSLFSPLALSHLILCAVPLTAIALSLVALRTIAQPDSRLIGRRAAMFGVVLGAFFLTLTLSSHFSRRHVICRQAEEYAAHWLDLVRGAKNEDTDNADQLRQKRWRLYEAFELTKEFDKRVPRGVDLDQLYGDTDAEFDPDQAGPEEPSQFDEARTSFQHMFQDEPLKTILSVGHDGELRYDGVHSYLGQKDGHSVALAFSLTYRDGGETKTLPFLVYARRGDLEVADEPPRKQWRIESVGHVP